MGEPWQQTAAELVKARREAKAAKWTARVALLLLIAGAAGWLTGTGPLDIIAHCEALHITNEHASPAVEDPWVSHAVEAVAELRREEIERLRHELRAAYSKIDDLENTAKELGFARIRSLAVR